MKIHEISDLHTEGSKYDLKSMPDADVLILAGDILSVAHLDPVLGNGNIEFWSKKYKDVIVLFGNHEYYRSSFPVAKAKYKSYLNTFSNVHLLDNNIVLIDDVLFAGTTLWTNFKDGNPEVTDAASRYINDFHVIEGFTWVNAAAEFEKAYKFIERVADDGRKKKVMITHFTPSHKSIHPRWGDDPCNYYFSNNIPEDYIKTFKYWFHGHTHDSFDYMIGDCRVICNPKGYGRENAMNFKPQMVVEI